MKMKNNKTAVITGATGMLALALMRRLISEGYYIYAVARPDSPRIADIPESDMITTVKCDMHNYKNLSSMINSCCDIFFHFAWEGTSGNARNDMALQTRNIRASAEAVSAAAELGCQVFLGAGSQAEYGRKECAVTPDMPAFPENGYGMAKLCAGQMTRLMCKEKGIKHIWCRIFSVYGPYDGNQTMIMSSVRKLIDGGTPCFTPAEQMWDYLYCDDAAAALYLAAVKGRDGHVYCVGSGEVRMLRDYITELRDRTDPAAQIEIGAVPYSENQVMYLCADITSLKEDTGFIPQYSFSRGISATIEWYKLRLNGGGTDK
ncbi:MAG: NAD(P)-dependent oxidoreductase [Oscillospiraceae bacterium]|nr:NAD(P)-dependent oxidoreductase [Oscillospiraceae bacterium]